MPATKDTSAEAQSVSRAKVIFGVRADLLPVFILGSSHLPIRSGAAEWSPKPFFFFFRSHGPGLRN